MRWTKDEIVEFDRLIEGVGSRNQIARIEARLAQREFVAKHGKDKCDAMFAHIENGGKKEDFNDELSA